MLFQSLIVIITLQFPLIKPCVRTIPPEEVYITSTPDNLPGPPVPVVPVITQAPIMENPENPPVTNAPVTNAPAKPCFNCDIEAIAPTIPAGTSFSYIDREDLCKTTVITCATINMNPCDSIVLRADLPGSTETLDTQTNVNKLTWELACQENEKYASVFFADITRLYCDFSGCP